MRHIKTQVAKQADQYLLLDAFRPGVNFVTFVGLIDTVGQIGTFS